MRMPISTKSSDLSSETLHGTPRAYPRRGQKRRKKGGFFIAFFSFVFLLSMAAGSLFYLYLRYAPLPPSNVANASTLTADDGTVLTDLFKGGHNRLRVPLQEIPPYLREATIAVEDDQFYSHHGFNFAGIARALYVDLKSGQILEGGSTITQQLAKKLYLSDERTLTRKIKEAVRTMQLEINYSKDQILEQYLNIIYYGEGAYGAEAAAETYFGKHVQDLDLAESAMLAGLPQSPSLLSPFVNEKGAKDRQRIVLDAMVKQGYITRQQADEAYKEPLKYVSKRSVNATAPHFTNYATAEAMQDLGIQENELVLGGYTIHTTLDPHMQKAAEDAVAKYLPKGDLEVALIALDPKTGEIKAMVGGRHFSDPGLNHVLAKRQPGSSFKPILYLTALNYGFTPATRIKSEPTTITYGTNGDKTYEVKNFANQYVHDFIDMRTAIARSDNVYAVTTNMDIGPEKVVDTAKKLGIESPLQPYPSLALGAFPVSPLEMVRAYAALANGGQKVQVHAVSSIDNAYQKTVYQFQGRTEPVADPKLTFILTDLMKGVFEPDGTAYRVANMIDRPVAGKTGTTDTDAWMIGYTPDLVTAVWVGYDKDRLLSQSESHVAAPIWAEFMKNALANREKTDFPKPEGVVQVAIDPTTGQLATPNCPVQHPEYFVIGTEPTEECAEHPASIPGKIRKKLQNGSSTLHKVWDFLTGGKETP
jgi:1A family penicillin-binding protein